MFLGSFGQIQLLWQRLTTCPYLKGKKENVITFAKSVRILRVMACWKALWISHPPKKFQNIGIVVACPKSLNSIYGTHSLLGVKCIRDVKPFLSFVLKLRRMNTTLIVLSLVSHVLATKYFTHISNTLAFILNTLLLFVLYILARNLEYMYTNNK